LELFEQADSTTIPKNTPANRFLYIFIKYILSKNREHP